MGHSVTDGSRWQNDSILMLALVADADFAADDRQYIGYYNNANDTYWWIADGSR